MRIGIIDADLISRRKHRFPNLACEKLSGYWKSRGAEVDLLMDYDAAANLLGVGYPLSYGKNLTLYDRIYISKVFTDTPVPDYIQDLIKNPNERVFVGGTGFYFDKAPNLPDVIEHQMPDYHLYDQWIASEVEKARTERGDSFNESSFMVQFKEYTDYSIGFVTRGCFRKCKFCVNQKYDHVFLHSPVKEFFDPTRKKICLLDDNFLGCPEWRNILDSILSFNRPFKFKQGLDERLLTEEKCQLLFSAKYDGDYTFAFDNIQDYDLVKTKLEMIRRHTASKNIKFYVLVGFESTDAQDIENAFKRISLLMKYQCLPYVMRYQDRNHFPWKESVWRSMYVTLARWANQPSFYKKMSFREFCEANQAIHKTEGTLCSSKAALVDFETKHPDIAAKYFDLHFPENNELGGGDEYEL